MQFAVESRFPVIELWTLGTLGILSFQEFDILMIQSNEIALFAGVFYLISILVQIHMWAF